MMIPITGYVAGNVGKVRIVAAGQKRWQSTCNCNCFLFVLTKCVEDTSIQSLHMHIFISGNILVTTIICNKYIK